MGHLGSAAPRFFLLHASRCLRAGVALLFLVAIVDGAAAQSQQRHAAQRAYGEGVARLATQGDLPGAYAAFRTAAAHDSTYAPALFNAGVVASALGYTSAAHRWWRAFLRVDSTSVFAARARSYVRQLDAVSTPRASASYETLLARARIEIDRRDFPAATETLRAAAQLHPQRWETSVLLARMFAMSNRPVDASAALLLAWSTAPDSIRPKIRQALYEVQANSPAASGPSKP